MSTTHTLKLRLDSLRAILHRCWAAVRGEGVSSLGFLTLQGYFLPGMHLDELHQHEKSLQDLGYSKDQRVS